MKAGLLTGQLCPKKYTSPNSRSTNETLFLCPLFSAPPPCLAGFEHLRESSLAALGQSSSLCVDRPLSAFPFILSPGLPCDHFFLCAFASQRLCVNLLPFAWIALSAHFPLSYPLPFLAIIFFFAPSRLSVFALIFYPLRRSPSQRLSLYPIPCPSLRSFFSLRLRVSAALR